MSTVRLKRRHKRSKVTGGKSIRVDKKKGKWVITYVADKQLHGGKVACACGGDEVEAGREHGETGKGYGMSGPDVRGKGKWAPKPKGKCYYETGDEADRCYVTQKGGPGGQTKPGPSTNKGDWKTYEKQRW